MNLINPPAVLAVVPLWLYPVAMVTVAILFAWGSVVITAMFFPRVRKDYRIPIFFAIFGAVVVPFCLAGLNS